MGATFPSNHLDFSITYIMIPSVNLLYTQSTERFEHLKQNGARSRTSWVEPRVRGHRPTAPAEGAERVGLHPHDVLELPGCLGEEDLVWSYRERAPARGHQPITVGQDSHVRDVIVRHQCFPLRCVGD